MIKDAFKTLEFDKILARLRDCASSNFGNSLASFGKEKLLASGIDCSRRAETLSLEEFAGLCNFLKG